jgi:hypothetical protein
MEKLKFDDLPEAMGRLLAEFSELKNFLLNPPTPPPTEGRKLMTRHEVRDLLKLKSLTTVDSLSRKNLLKKHQMGGVVRFYEDEVLAFAETKTKKRGAK